jgi:hypothetical protein
VHGWSPCHKAPDARPTEPPISMLTRRFDCWISIPPAMRMPPHQPGDELRGVAAPGCLGRGYEPHLTGVRRLSVRASRSLEMTAAPHATRAPRHPRAPTRGTSRSARLPTDSFPSLREEVDRTGRLNRTGNHRGCPRTRAVSRVRSRSLKGATRLLRNSRRAATLDRPPLPRSRCLSRASPHSRPPQTFTVVYKNSLVSLANEEAQPAEA